MPSLENILSATDLRRDVVRRSRGQEIKSIPHREIPQAEAGGWCVLRKSKTTARVAKDKPIGTWFEDRIWLLMYRLGFSLLSGPKGAKLMSGHSDSLTNQLDVVAIDHEVALAIECKSSSQQAKRRLLQLELAKHGQMRLAFQQAVIGQWPSEFKRATAFAFFTHHAQLSENDRARAEQADIALLDDHDLEYYEELVSQVGPAARYQFLADLLPGRTIPGLKSTFPAVRTKMGGYQCYTFSATPDFLQKIAYVSHRSKGRASDVDTYQRMMRRTRLKKIAEYIHEHGIFPTNIVLSLARDDRGRRTRFQAAEQKGEGAAEGTFGWLQLNPSYKAAWVIDGQHRLYAYSGLPEAKTSQLAVLAFVGLPADRQAQLFIDINAEQKSVRRSLLQELFAELHWNSDVEMERVNALISKTIQVLGLTRESALFDRIRLTDQPRTDLRCLTITTFFSVLGRSGFFHLSVKGGKVFEPGPLWAADMNQSLSRASRLLDQWFIWIRDGAPDWWALGAERPGGGLAMNDSIAACLQVLRSSFEALASRGARLASLSTEELVRELKPYGEALGEYFGSLTAEQRQSFRELRGVQGQTRATRHAQRAIRSVIPDFSPDGLDEFIREEEANTRDRAEGCIRELETMLQQFVVDTLKAEFTGGDEEWWFEGVPEQIRKAVRQRMEEEKAAHQPREHFFDLIHYRAIVQKNWSLFQNSLAYGKKGDKDARTAWMVKVNEMRKTVAHASRGGTITVEQLEELEGYRGWLREQIAADEDRQLDHSDDTKIDDDGSDGDELSSGGGAGG